MKFSNEEKKLILNNFLKVIKRLSDIDYQKRVWINGQGPEADDFDEATCQFFDMGNPIIENYKNFSILESQYDLLIKFRDEFRVFSQEKDIPQDFIDNSEWKKVVNLAQEILKAFNF